MTLIDKVLGMGIFLAVVAFLLAMLLHALGFSARVSGLRRSRDAKESRRRESRRATRLLVFVPVELGLGDTDRAAVLRRLGARRVSPLR
jgi:hypothetical protein